MKNKKIWIICAGCCVVVILALIWGLPKSGPKSEYDQAAKDAAEKLFKQEVEDYRSFTTVKTGKLKYFFTMYNEEKDKYLVTYCTRFDEADEDEDQWIAIKVYLDGSSLAVESSTAVYGDKMYYEDLKDNIKHKRIVNDKDGEWKTID